MPAGKQKHRLRSDLAPLPRASRCLGSALKAPCAEDSGSCLWVCYGHKSHQNLSCYSHNHMFPVQGTWQP